MTQRKKEEAAQPEQPQPQPQRTKEEQEAIATLLTLSLDVDKWQRDLHRGEEALRYGERNLEFRKQEFVEEKAAYAKKHDSSIIARVIGELIAAAWIIVIAATSAESYPKNVIVSGLATAMILTVCIRIGVYALVWFYRFVDASAEEM